MVHAMVRRGIEYPFKQSEFANKLGVKPRLIGQHHNDANKDQLWGKTKSIFSPNNSNCVDAIFEITFFIDTISKRYDVIISYGFVNIESIALDLLPHRKTLTIRAPLA